VVAFPLKMSDRLTDLQGRVENARTALEALAERAARLRVRLEATRPPGAVHPTPTSGPGAALASSLDRLTHAVPAGRVAAAELDEREGDDGRFLSDAWEIALINEEGK
jgi:hypothetical protein